MTARSWIDDEPSAGSALRQAAALLRSGLERPTALFLVSTLFLALCAGALLLDKHSYTPRLVLRVVEPDRDPTKMPRPSRQLTEYVRQVVFTSGPLLELIRRYGLYPNLARKNPRAAVDSFREDTDVSVHQNYFLEERTVGSAPRSARVWVSYQHSNPEVAVGVTRDLGAMIVEHEIATRRDEAARAAERAKSELDAARQVLVARRSEIAMKREDLARSPRTDPGGHVELVGLMASLPALEQRQDRSEQHEAAFALGAALERRGIGMSFDVVDDASVPPDSWLDSPILFATLSFVLAMPLLAMAVGAFVPKTVSS